LNKNIIIAQYEPKKSFGNNSLTFGWVCLIFAGSSAMRNLPRSLSFAILLLVSSCICHAQISLMDIVDTSSTMHISGYIQPQYQVASEKGIQSYSGGNFPPHSNNRFMLRRGRIRFDYINNQTVPTKPSIHFVVQLDGTERGVFIRDVWGRVLENKWKSFALTAGMFARPFGFEVSHSSSDRESPERGRMSQILMKTERDLGAMATFNPRDEGHPLHWLKVDAGIFNGPGLSSPNDYDNFKDFITRVSVRPPQTGSLQINGGLSYYNGGILQQTKYINEVENINGKPQFVTDSSVDNIGGKAPRRYKGADIQLKWKYGKATTEVRAEYWRGKQTSTAATSETPPELPEEPLYTRNFDGAFFYLLHRFFDKHEFGLKYDWYDPNTDASGNVLTLANHFHASDIRYNTLGFGYIYYMNENCKLVLWYDMVNNESSGIPGYTTDVKDNVFTCRLQFQF
jgi:hypothetical protein